MEFKTRALPARALLAKYAAWVVDQFPTKGEAANFLQLSRNTLDQLLKEAAHHGQRQSRHY